jgi:hypothetical protein
LNITKDGVGEVDSSAAAGDNKIPAWKGAIPGACREMAAATDSPPAD